MTSVVPHRHTLIRPSTEPARVAVFINGAAGRGNVRGLARGARSQIWGYRVELHCPTSRGAMIEELNALDTHGLRAVVMCGGDGTINTATEVLAARGIPLISFPAGTANDLAAQMGWKPSWAQVQETLDGGKTRSIDLIEVNGKSFSTVGGIGVGARLVKEFNQVRQLSPSVRRMLAPLKDQVYTLLSLKTLLLNQDYWQRLEIRTRTFHETLKVAAVFVCNQGVLGGDMKISDRADPTDGRMEIVVITASNRFELIDTLLKFKEGKQPRSAITLFDDHVTISQPEGNPIRFFGDGEILVESPVLEISVRPAALTIMGGER